MKFLFKFILLTTTLFLLFIFACTENPTQSQEDKFLGTWGLGRSVIIYTDSTKTENIGTDIPHSYIIFKSNKTFELLEVETDKSSNNNTWSLENNQLILTFENNSSQIWNYSFDKDTMILSRDIIDENKKLERTFAKRKNVIDSKLLGEWKLNAKLVVTDTGEVNESPDITGISETLSFQDNGSFTERINDNGNLTTLNGSWSALLGECLIFRYSSGNIKIKFYNVNDVLTFDWSYINNNVLYYVISEYSKN